MPDQHQVLGDFKKATEFGDQTHNPFVPGGMCAPTAPPAPPDVIIEVRVANGYALVDLTTVIMIRPDRRHCTLYITNSTAQLARDLEFHGTDDRDKAYEILKDAWIKYKLYTLSMAKG